MASIHLSHQSSSSVPRAKSFQQPLAKRLLFPFLPPDAPLPPLFLSQHSSSELEAELYDFIALALRAYVHPWWSKITRYDKELIPEINHIIVLLIQVLETRLRSVDIPSLLLRDIPLILTQHYRDYRNATSKISTSYATSGAASLPQLFHQLQPHMAISADGSLNEEYYRQLIDRFLGICLSPHDYAPDVERLIIREAILKAILIDILPKATKPWFLQLAILNLVESGHGKNNRYLSPSSKLEMSSSSPPTHAALVLLLSTVQKVSGVCLSIVHTYRQAVNTIKLVNRYSQGDSLPPSPSTQSPQEHSAPLLPSSSERRLSDTPGENSSILDVKLPSPSASALPSRESSSTGKAPHYPPSSRVFHPVHVMSLLTLLSEVFNAADRFATLVLTTTISIFVALVAPFCHRLIPHIIMSFFSSTFILDIIRLSKRTLFPNGYPLPAEDDPSLEEQAEIRARLVAYQPTGLWGNTILSSFELY
ncbi:hypothetical protein AMATHDRAFT_222 [Amanita thiersii Skay4041]|uniref:PXA domain-containing protein n=1 Tax=Amanita thiersii Skay4041 TaxID=703135 RepID=A0A2A9NVT7_9AGAR|nr:hypothetical protein AMATHDRAFT_222 [Amanita thiersii Skay4041]